MLVEELVAGDQRMVPQTPPDGDTEQQPVSEQTMTLQNTAVPTAGVRPRQQAEELHQTR